MPPSSLSLDSPMPILPPAVSLFFPTSESYPLVSWLENMRWKPPGQDQNNSGCIIGTLSGLLPSLASVPLSRMSMSSLLLCPLHGMLPHSLHLLHPPRKLRPFSFLTTPVPCTPHALKSPSPGGREWGRESLVNLYLSSGS